MVPGIRAHHPTGRGKPNRPTERVGDVFAAARRVVDLAGRGVALELDQLARQALGRTHG
jgi:hypothetical protein